MRCVVGVQQRSFKLLTKNKQNQISRKPKSKVHSKESVNQIGDDKVTEFTEEMKQRAEKIKEEGPKYITQQEAKLKEDPLDIQTLNETLKQYKNLYTYSRDSALR